MNKQKDAGTHGRTWLSEKNKNILMTILIYPNCTIDRLETITMDIANCLVIAAKEVYDIHLSIKEPNDLMLNNKKIGGILTETKVEEEYVKNLFIGIGININQEEFSEELASTATSLKKELGQEFEREKLVIDFINNFENILEEKIKSI